MSQQTALEWLKMKLEDIQSQNEYANPYNPEPISYKYIMFLLDYALEMEKDQIINAWRNGDNHSMYEPKQLDEQAEQYYNETYKK